MEALFHLIVPTLAALSVGFERKRVLMLAVLTVLPDLDHVLVYRALFHNVFFLLLVTAVVYAATTRDREAAFLAALFIGSHLLFDIGGGIAVFYPLDDGYYAIQASIVGKDGTVPRFEMSLTRSNSAEWTSALRERLSRVERVWASTEMAMVLTLLLAAFRSRPAGRIAAVVGVSTHNHESRSHHRALRHHPPKRTGGG